MSHRNQLDELKAMVKHDPTMNEKFWEIYDELCVAIADDEYDIFTHNAIIDRLPSQVSNNFEEAVYCIIKDVLYYEEF